MSGVDYAITELKAHLDSALIQLEVKHHFDHANPELVAVRTAGDELFASMLHKKFEVLKGGPFNFRQFVEDGGLQRSR